MHPPTDKFISLVLICLFLLSCLKFLQNNVPGFVILSGPADPIANRTLGFETIYALALPERQDRTRPLLDAANATNLTITVLNAVRDAEIPRESWPKGWKEEDHAAGELGCLVSHARAWNNMISQNISTALILESDADWDMRIHTIMPNLRPAISALIDWPISTPDHLHPPSVKPYGDRWDILWLGHCGCSHDGNVRKYEWNDTSVPPPGRTYVFDVGLAADQYTVGTRAMFQFNRATCSTTYAISLAGAKKMAKVTQRVGTNLDINLSDACRQEADMYCLGIWPQIFTSARSKSNIDHGHGSKNLMMDHDMKGVVTPGLGIQFSARVNAERVLKKGLGEKGWKGEWDTSWAVVNGSVWAMVDRNGSAIDTTPRPVHHRLKVGGG